MRRTLVSAGGVVHRAVWLTLGLLLTATALFPAIMSPISPARADLLEYTYTGSPYTLFNTQPGEAGYPYYSASPGPDSPYSSANGISGSVIIDTGNLGITAATFGIVDFLSVSDGVTTYSGPAQLGDITFVSGSLTIDNSGNVTDGEFAVYRPASNGFTRLFVNPTEFPNTVPAAGGVAAPYYAGADAFLSTIFEALSGTPGTWSAPTALTTGSPTSSACAALIANSVTPSVGGAIFSASGQPISISATFTPLTGSLSAAETDCGVAKFDWQQTVTNYPQPSPFPLTAPFLDPQSGGYGNGNYYAYCNKSIDTTNPADITMRLIPLCPATQLVVAEAARSV